MQKYSENNVGMRGEQGKCKLPELSSHKMSFIKQIKTVM